VRTGPDGTFEFETIRPASYPGTRIPQHVHVELETDEGRFHAGEWRFADDPMVEEGEKAASARAGRFGWVCPVHGAGTASEIRVNVRVKPEGRF
jgi:protocatechuate 3,4-dioxygenase beta subunit